MASMQTVEKRSGICIDFTKGRCNRGESCRFAHVAPAEEIMGPDAMGMPWQPADPSLMMPFQDLSLLPPMPMGMPMDMPPMDMPPMDMPPMPQFQ